MAKPILFSTTDVIETRAYFHDKPWTHDSPPNWKRKHTLVMALKVDGAALGDVVSANLVLKVTAYNFYDVRENKANPGVRLPGNGQLNVLCRVAKKMPDKTVVDLEPGKTGPLGFCKMPGAPRLFVNDYGNNIWRGGTFSDNGTGSPVRAAEVYTETVRNFDFTVWWPTDNGDEVWLLVYLAPESAGADKTCFLDVPDSSNYSLFNCRLYKGD